MSGNPSRRVAVVGATGVAGQQFLVSYMSPGRWSNEAGLVPASGEGELVNLSRSGYEDWQPRWALEGEAMFWQTDRFGNKRQAGWSSEWDVRLGFFTEKAWDRFQLSEVELEHRLYGSTAGGPSARPLPDWSHIHAELGKKGVTVHDPSRAQRGFNLYSSRESNSAQLIDMDGKVVHRWEATVHGANMWQMVELLPDGELLVIAADHALFKLDRDSNIGAERQ